jgi:hypothetical protein
MKVMAQLKKVFSIGLIVLSLWFGTAVSIDANHVAIAKSRNVEADNYDFSKKSGNSVDAYRQLQRKTYAYRNEGLEGEGSQTGRLGNRVELAERSAKKLQQRMDQRQDLSSQTDSVDDAAQNMMDNTRDAFQRSAGRVKRNLKLGE